jgi:hypothetical protein
MGTFVGLSIIAVPLAMLLAADDAQPLRLRMAPFALRYRLRLWLSVALPLALSSIGVAVFLGAGHPRWVAAMSVTSVALSAAVFIPHARLRRILQLGALFGMGAASLFVIPAAAPSRYLGYQTKTTLRLPFDGTWKTLWGGRTVRDNYHARARDQRFAYDFVAEAAGREYRTDGKTNQDYLAFGRPVVAPGSGVVIEARGDLADNRPGEQNEAQPLGNHVIIDHQNGEFSFVAHLRQDSVRVHTGEVVTAGTPLGECGNSGHSDRPHVHYHLQTTGRFLDGDGLPAQFQRYQADGHSVDRGEPRRGQSVDQL